ncbi:MAG TPA: hypothetical protein VFU22_12405 [Roseiflexaceae bacterium]|nr:hypothetical protein [Roseiflexaceae bacterium]
MNAFALGIQRCVCRGRLAWQCGCALVLSLLSAAPALACTPPPGGLPSITIAQRVQAADVVLRGTITNVAVENFRNYTATIVVQSYYKGSGLATVTIANFGTGADCRSAVHVGDDWIFFAKGDPNGLMQANYLSQFDAITTPTADTIAQILAALNSRPRAYLPLLASSTPIEAAAPTPSEDATLFGITLLAVGAGALLARRLVI